MTVLAGLGGVMLLLLIWSAHDLGRHAEHRVGIAVLAGVAVPALLVLAIMGALAGSLAAAAVSLLAVIAIPVGLSGPRPRRRLRLLAPAAPVAADLPAEHAERRAA
jgi:hypothetical protein